MEAHEAGRMGRLKRVMRRRVRDSMVVTHALSWGHGYGRDVRAASPRRQLNGSLVSNIFSVDRTKSHKIADPRGP